MFRRLGQFAVRYPRQIIVCWFVVLIAVLVSTPRLASVVSSSQSTYLPATANSMQAQSLLLQGFSSRFVRSSAQIVLTGPQAARNAAIADYSNFAAHDLNPAPFSVLSDTLTPQFRKTLDSADGAATLITVGWKAVDSTSTPTKSLKALRSYIKAHPYPGVVAKTTGDVAINLDYQTQVGISTNITTVATIVLVVLIMLLVFRSVALLLVPLLTIGLSVVISFGLVAELGTHGMVISNNTPIFMIVLLAGAGTDYCLFIASRYREELSQGKDPATALVETMTHVGEAITFSAAAVFLGVGGMIFAQFGLFNTTGPAVAIGIVVMLAAALTITPALLALLGHNAFWPTHSLAVSPPRFWVTVGRRVTTHPVIAVVLLLVLLLPLNAAVLKTSQDFNFLTQLGPKIEARSGSTIVQAHFGAGKYSPTVLVISDPSSFWNTGKLDALDALATRLLAIPGVATVQGPTRPVGQPIPYRYYQAEPKVQAAIARDISTDGHVVQFTVTTTGDPYGSAARVVLQQVLSTAATAFPDAQVHTSGGSSFAADVHDVINSDLLRIGLIVVGGIFLVLVLLLRAVVAPLYLLATVLLSLGATVGATTLVFQGLVGDERPGILGAVPDSDDACGPFHRLQHSAGHPYSRGGAARGRVSRGGGHGRRAHRRRDYHLRFRARRLLRHPDAGTGDGFARNGFCRGFRRDAGYPAAARGAGAGSVGDLRPGGMDTPKRAAPCSGRSGGRGTAARAFTRRRLVGDGLRAPQHLERSECL